MEGGDIVRIWTREAAPAISEWREEEGVGDDGSVGGAVVAKEDEKRVRWRRHRKGGGRRGGCGPWCMGDRREREMREREHTSFFLETRERTGEGDGGGEPNWTKSVFSGFDNFFRSKVLFK